MLARRVVALPDGKKLPWLRLRAMEGGGGISSWALAHERRFLSGGRGGDLVTHVIAIYPAKDSAAQEKFAVCWLIAMCTCPMQGVVLAPRSELFD